MEILEADETQADSGAKTKNIDDYLTEIDQQANALIAKAERMQDSLMAQAVGTVAVGLKARARDVCTEGDWKDYQGLEKAIDKIGHSAKQKRKLDRKA